MPPVPAVADLGSEDATLEAGPQTGPVRLCAVSRVQMPVEQMLRFVAGPDGVVVPDLAQRLPGRGVWVDLCRVRLEEAVRRNVFAKSLKRQLTIAADLVPRIETLLVKRVLERLALANKAGLVVPGFAQVDASLETGKVAALFHGQDSSVGGWEKLDRKFAAICGESGQDRIVVTELTIDQMSLAIGRSNVVHTALISGGATARLLDEVLRLKRFRSLPDAL